MSASQPSRRQLLTLIAQADASHSLAESTKTKYISALNSFLAFCIRESLPPVPTVESLSLYVADACRHISDRTHKPLAPDTVDTYLSGIASSFENLYPNVRQITNHPQVRKTLKGCKIQFSVPVVRKDPLTLRDLVRVSFTSTASYDDLLFIAMLLTGFHGLHRLGEISIPDVVRYRNPRKIINRGSFSFSACGKYAKYLLPHCKTDPYFRGSQVIIASCAVTGACAVSALKSYLLRRDARFPLSSPLFLTVHGISPTRSWFLRFFRRFFDLNKSGHSMRSGGATTFAQAGLPLEHIQDMGRWSSDAFKIYVRDHPLMRLGTAQSHPLSLDGHLGSQVVFA